MVEGFAELIGYVLEAAWYGVEWSRPPSPVIGSLYRVRRRLELQARIDLDPEVATAFRATFLEGVIVRIESRDPDSCLLARLLSDVRTVVPREHRDDALRFGCVFEIPLFVLRSHFERARKPSGVRVGI